MQTNQHSIKPGAFFVCSWGYDQTNVDFYKVVAVTAKSVKIQQWTTKMQDGRVIPGDKPATWIDWSGVDQGADYWTRQEQQVERDSVVKIKRVLDYSDRPFLNMTSYSNAYLWDGRPKFDTRAAGQAGH